MKNAIYIFVLSCLLFFNKSNAQELQKVSDTLKVELIKTITGNFSYFNVDVFNNLYLINAKNQLIKYNEKGDSVGVFNDLRKYGKLSFIDVSNPFKILAFFNEYKYVVTLDQLLTFRNAINLRSKDFFNVSTIATSYDNNIWIFDERDFKLKKINDIGQSLLESADLRIISEETPKPTAIVQSKEQIFLYDENKGFFIFDNYGAYKNKIPLLKWKHPDVSNNKLLGFETDTIYTYELNSLNLKEWRMPSVIQDYEDLKFYNNHLFVLKKGTLNIYDIK